MDRPPSQGIASGLATFVAAGQPELLTAAKLIAARLEWFVARCAALFRQRVLERRLVEGHGDLRPEHVYLNGTPRIIDCLEFCAELRQLDPVNELAFLALECRRLGGPSLEGLLLQRYHERTGDAPPPELMRFYKALNALIRARIAIQRLGELGNRTPTEWITRSASYLAIAGKEAGYLSR